MHDEVCSTYRYLAQEIHASLPARRAPAAATRIERAASRATPVPTAAGAGPSNALGDDIFNVSRGLGERFLNLCRYRVKFGVDFVVEGQLLLLHPLLQSLNLGAVPIHELLDGGGTWGCAV